ncbi:PaaI family thioesterase [Piscinibacter sakaiensis]|uniref:PaaI family thioesterase n=1 Tax=Piscinibacter sakaiensis TaxID=1547922 RepID=UPI003AAA4C32
MNDRAIPQHVLDAFWQRWGNNSFMRAQGLQVEIAGIGEAIVRLPEVQETQRGGGGSADVLNGGVIAYMFDGALGCAIASALLERPEARSIDPTELRQSTINLDVTYIKAAVGGHFAAHGRVLRASLSTAFAEGHLLDSRGQICATAKGIWRVFWPRTAAQHVANPTTDSTRP